VLAAVLLQKGLWVLDHSTGAWELAVEIFDVVERPAQ
jgi:hypothetical protein